MRSWLRQKKKITCGNFCSSLSLEAINSFVNVTLLCLSLFMLLITISPPLGVKQFFSKHSGRSVEFDLISAPALERLDT